MELATSRRCRVGRATRLLDHRLVAPVVLIAGIVLDRFLHALRQEGGHIYQAIHMVRVAQPELQATDTTRGHKANGLNHVRPCVDVRWKPPTTSVVHEDTVGIGALQSLNGPIQHGGGRGEGGARRSGGPGAGCGPDGSAAGGRHRGSRCGCSGASHSRRGRSRGQNGGSSAAQAGTTSTAGPLFSIQIAAGFSTDCICGTSLTIRCSARAHARLLRSTPAVEATERDGCFDAGSARPNFTAARAVLDSGA
mmetsp:Transcript_13189/g.27564  ORF Transcript_13189/g.27564 Transcript_13189/m.27564 type:complete len:251 (+) Transcript_13189:2-754(+)